MDIPTRWRPIATLIALTLLLPAAYGAGGPHGSDSAEQGRLSFSHLQQQDDGVWTDGANASHTEGDWVPFRLQMSASAAGMYEVVVEYTATVTSSSNTADGYVAVGGPRVDGAEVVAHAARPGTVRPNGTTAQHVFTVSVPTAGDVTLYWEAQLGITATDYSILGPASISGARIHMSLAADGKRVVAMRTDQIALNPAIPTDPCIAGLCDVIPPSDPCTSDCEVPPVCTSDCEVPPVCTSDCEVPPVCTADCDVVIPPSDADPVDPVCAGTVRVRTVDETGEKVGPSRALVGEGQLVLAAGENEVADTPCGLVAVALTQVPVGFAVASTETTTAAGLTASSAHLAKTTVTVEDDATHEVVFVLAAVQTSPDVIEPPSAPETDPVVPTVPTPAEPTPDAGPDVISEVKDEPAATAPTTHDDSEVALAAPVPSSDVADAPRGTADERETVPALDTLPRTGADAPTLFLVSIALMAVGAVVLRRTWGPVREGS